MIEFSILALGGNQPSKAGNPNQTLSFALKSLNDRGVIIYRESSRYVTPAFPEGSGPDFVNSVALADSPFKPAELLEILHEVEEECGRQRNSRWGARTLDIDLLAAGQSIHPSEELYSKWSTLPLEKQLELAPEELILPHPRMQDRAFVLVPFAEVMPHWRHPVLGVTVTQMLEKLPESDRKAVVRLSES